MTKQNQRVKPSEDGLFPIRTVSTITGVNSITLRAWERRYGLITPVRTPKGHRLYTQNDIDLIQQVVGLLENGISIGQVKNHLRQKTVKQKQLREDDPWSIYQRRMLNAIIRFDTDALDLTYNETLSLYPIELVTRKMILPLLKTLGERWQTEEGNVAEEHFFGAYLRNKLGARFHHQSNKLEGPVLLAACLPGEHHEVGLMLFCLAAINYGYHVIYLGADLPIEEALIPLQRTHCDAIVFSGSVNSTNSNLQQQLTQLTHQTKIPVFIGGGVSIGQHDAIVSAGAIPIGTDITSAIKSLSQALEY